MAMDPISSSPLPLAGGIRPAQALQSDLSSVLRQGRIVAGEVLDLLGGGTIVIGLAGQRVQAENHVDLAPGDRFLARVEYVDGTLVLQLPAGNEAPDDALLRALRSLAGSELDARSMRELLEASGAEAQSLPAVFQPEEGGAGLAQLVRQGGLFQESALLSVASDERHGDSQGLALAALATRILSAAGLADDPDSPALLAALRTALVAGLDELGAGANAARALDAGLELRGELVRQLGVHALDPSRALLRAYLAGLDAPALEHTGWLPWVALLLGDRLAFSERGLRRRALVQLLQEDFKARLAAQSQQAATELEREAAGRALRGVQAEQLRNLARARLGEPLHIGFLVPEGAHTANAHLFVPARREGAPDASSGAGEQGERVTLAVEFSRLGALRAEILLKHDRLHVRLGVARPESAQLLRGGLEALERQLSVQGRELNLSVVPHEPGRSDPAGADLAYLRQHHLMDLSG
jgi:hypothetical protein